MKKYAVGFVVVGLMALSIYLFVTTMFEKLDAAATAAATTKQALEATNRALEIQTNSTTRMVEITQEVNKKADSIAAATRRNTILIDRGLKRDAQINVDSPIMGDVVVAMCLQWKASGSSSAQQRGEPVSISSDRGTPNPPAAECEAWRTVTTREAYQYILILLEHVGKLNSKLEGLDAYGREQEKYRSGQR